MSEQAKSDPPPADWSGLSDAEAEEAMKAKAGTDPGYAIAWAVTQLAHAQWATVEVLDALGLNTGDDENPGVGQVIATALLRLVDQDRDAPPMPRRPKGH